VFGGCLAALAHAFSPSERIKLKSPEPVSSRPVHQLVLGILN
jgi:hypothetical protein